jgi:hypothetical protein
VTRLVGLTAQKCWNFDALLVCICLLLRLWSRCRRTILDRWLLTHGTLLLPLRLAFALTLTGHPVDQRVDAKARFVSGLTSCGHLLLRCGLLGLLGRLLLLHRMCHWALLICGRRFLSSGAQAGQRLW